MRPGVALRERWPCFKCATVACISNKQWHTRHRMQLVLFIIIGLKRKRDVIDVHQLHSILLDFFFTLFIVQGLVLGGSASNLCSGMNFTFTAHTYSKIMAKGPCDGFYKYSSLCLNAKGAFRTMKIIFHAQFYRFHLVQHPQFSLESANLHLMCSLIALALTQISLDAHSKVSLLL